MDDEYGDYCGDDYDSDYASDYDFDDDDVRGDYFPSDVDYPSGGEPFEDVFDFGDGDADAEFAEEEEGDAGFPQDDDQLDGEFGHDDHFGVGDEEHYGLEDEFGGGDDEDEGVERPILLGSRRVTSSASHERVLFPFSPTVPYQLEVDEEEDEDGDYDDGYGGMGGRGGEVNQPFEAVLEDDGTEGQISRWMMDDDDDDDDDEYGGDEQIRREVNQPYRLRMGDDVIYEGNERRRRDVNVSYQLRIDDDDNRGQEQRIREEVNRLVNWRRNNGVGDEQRRETNEASEQVGLASVGRGVGCDQSGNNRVAVTVVDGFIDKGKEKVGATSSSRVAVKGEELDESEIDGMSCPICMDPWTSDGEHTICCLPCGHLYGMSCIKSWLQQQNPGKCPQCNKVCKLEDVRRLYGAQIAVVDKELQEKIRLLEARCVSLQLKDADWCRKEAEWKQKEADLQLQLTQQNEAS
ncbi:hypothetical protein Ancab_014526 [Ancistrocladus abbreviatus]